MRERLLEISDLTLERGERRLFDRFKMAVNQGQIVQLAGPNGVGKTTLLRAISGLLQPQSGAFLWRGEQATANQYSDEIFYLGHKPAVSMQLTPEENLRQFQLSRRVANSFSSDLVSDQNSDSTSDSTSDSKVLWDALTQLGLTGYQDELCARLSAGQKRRVSLAKLLLSKATLWLLDEPFTAIDSTGIQFLCARMANFARAGGAILFTSHQAVTFPNYDYQVIDLNNHQQGHD